MMEALTLIGADEPSTIHYFGDVGLFDPYPSPSSVFVSDRMKHYLKQCYKRKIFSLHPDKSGNGDAEELHRVKAAWAELKQCLRSPIDLTNDSESDDIDDDEEHESEGEGTSREHSLNPCDALVACGVSNPSASCEGGKADFAEKSNREDAESVDETNFPLHQSYVGKRVRKGFWFQGRVTSLDIGKNEEDKEVVLVHVEFDDEDKEDYEPHELESEVEIDNKSTLSDGKFHPLGAVVWKKFILEGKVTGCRIGEKNVIFIAFCCNNE